MDGEFIYTGQDILEALQDAVNYSRYQYKFINDEISKITKNERIKVLDFGAGIGTHADELRKDKRLPVDCLEPDSEQAKILEKKGYKVYKDLSEITEKYDVIYALNVFEHIEDDNGVLAAVKPIVADGGVVIIYVPAFNLLWTNLDNIVKHYRRYRIHDMRRLSRASGLKLRQVRYCDPLGFAAALAYRAGGGSGQLKPGPVRLYDKYLFPPSVALEVITRKLFGKNVLGIYVN